MTVREALKRIALLAVVLAGAGPQPLCAGSGEQRSPGAATTSPAGAVVRLEGVEEEKVRIVLVPASVEDRQGRIVRGLKAEDFVLLEERVPRKIESFWVEEGAPVRLAFLLDVSGSMGMSGKLEAAKEGIRYLVESLRADDEAALICFADEQVSWVTDFTADRRRFLERLAVQEGYGKTALHDAIGAAPALVEERTIGRKAIVLFTDGVDNASRLAREEAIALARRVNVPIYAVTFTTLPPAVRRGPDTGTNLEALREIAQETGGALFVVYDPDELKEAVQRIDQELRYQYLLAFRPSADVWDGRYRRIELLARKGKYVVRARKGYYAAP
jgi:Ca-activated chloride channel family protein